MYPQLKLITMFSKTVISPPECVTIQWNNLDSKIPASPPYSLFEKRIFEFIKPHPNSNFNVPNSLRLIYLTRLRVGHNFHFAITFMIHQVRYAAVTRSVKPQIYLFTLCFMLTNYKVDT